MANPYFNAAYYLAQNPDLAIAGYTVATVEQHYNQYGANESANFPNRAPNTWFNAQTYLLANPDLTAAGIGLSGALAHFAQYGVTEGRMFSSNPALVPSNFNAKAYATANADVANAFGITNVDSITSTQAGQLMGHYLAYGAAEGRAGTGAFVVNPSNTIPVDSITKVILGTTGDDVFTWAVAPGGFSGASLNGLAGNDTVKITSLNGDTAVTLAAVENIVVDAVGAAAAATLTVTGSGVQSVSVNNAVGKAFTYAGEKVAALTLKGAGTVEGKFTGVTGTTDALQVTTASTAAQTLTVNGIEQFNVKVGNTSTDLTLNANSVQGSSLTATLTGGKAEVENTFTLGSATSGDLATVTIDGSAALGKQTLELDTAGSGNKALSITIKGGANTDILHANKGIDTLTGGAKNDQFNFSAGDAIVKLVDSKIAAVDTITDFTKNSDTALNDKIVAADFKAIGAVTAGLGTVDIGTGVLTFATGVTAGKTLTEVVTLLSTDATLVAGAGNAVIFAHGGNTYAFATDGVAADIQGDALIQITGVAASDLKIVATGIEFAL